MTLRAQLESVARQTGKAPKALAEGPQIPDAVAYLFNWFGELSRGRGHNGFGPSALGHPDIAAMASNYGLSLYPWEVRALFGLDARWMRVQHDSRPPPQKGAPDKKPAKRKG